MLLSSIWDAWSVAQSFLSRPVASGLVPLQFLNFPPGAVKPHGWALNQARIQANGLAGQAAEKYYLVANTTWTGGPIEYSGLMESAPYWFNGIVPLAFQLNDTRLKAQAKEFLDYVLDHQGTDGWIGPDEYNRPGPRLVWPRYLTLWGMIQYAEADPTETERIVNATHRFISGVHDLFMNGTYDGMTTGLFEWQWVRWEELVLSLQWLYDKHPQGQEERLIETMRRARDVGYSWKNDWYTEENFPKVSSKTMDGNAHVVNNAEAVKGEALAYRFTQDHSDYLSTRDRINMLMEYHGRPSGIFSGDEFLAGLHPGRGSETCAVVEMMYSLEVNYMIFGSSSNANSWADQVEKLAYNALPAALLPDMTARQYLQQDNQIWSKERFGEEYVWHDHGDNGYSNVFGLETNYPCCTVDFPQGYPKFWAHSFLFNAATGELAHIFLGPTIFSHVLPSANEVKVTVDTIYPFGSTLHYSVECTEPFTFAIRIPSWAQSSSTLSFGGKTTRIKPSNHFLPITLSAGHSEFSLNLDMAVRIETRANNSISIHRGPLLYAINLAYNHSSVAARRAPTLRYIGTLPNVPPELKNKTDPYFHDHFFLPSTPWNLAIDPSTLTIHLPPSEDTARLPHSVWETHAQPIKMSALACEINWPVVLDDADWPPASPNRCLTGERKNVTLTPYGGTRLRIAVIPTFDGQSL